MVKKVNIAFLLTRVSERGGISRVVSILTDELYKKNILGQIHIVSFQKKDERGYPWNENLTIHELLDDTPSMKKGILKANIKLRGILSKNDIDILVSCGHLVGPLGVLSSVFKKTKLIYWSHTSYIGSRNSNFRLFNEHIAALFSKAVVSLTKVDKINYKKKTLAKNVFHIYNPVDKKLLSNKIAYDSNSKLIVSVGRLTYQKNFELLVDVAKLVLNKYPDHEWHIYGSGENKDDIQHKISNYNLQNQLFLKGQSNNLYEIYKNYSMMVMTSRYEGFPMTLLEGMAFGLPLVSFDIPTGPNEIIRENTNGFLIEPFDVEKMADRICHLLENKETRTQFSAKNIEFLTDFDMESISPKWIQLFQSIVKQ